MLTTADLQKACAYCRRLMPSHEPTCITQWPETGRQS